MHHFKMFVLVVAVKSGIQKVLLTKWVTHSDVYRATLATPGLLTICWSFQYSSFSLLLSSHHVKILVPLSYRWRPLAKFSCYLAKCLHREEWVAAAQRDKAWHSFLDQIVQTKYVTIIVLVKRVEGVRFSTAQAIHPGSLWNRNRRSGGA